MSLDLISAQHQHQIDGTQRIFSLDEDFHARLLALAQPRTSYPLLHKMRDYYAETVFLLGELRALHAELARITSKFTDRSQARELSRFVVQAIADGDNLYATAD